MNPLADTDTETILSGTGECAGPALQRALAAYPLDGIETEYPHHGGAVESADDSTRPSEDHPVFYGCFDWHSAVHSHWCLIRQLRLFDHPQAEEIRTAIDGRLTPSNVEQEVAYFADNPTFERAYGWAWLLRLAAELALWDDPQATEWRDRLDPLESKISSLVEQEFLTQDRPLRVGTHHNTAFALTGILDYARVVADDHLESAATDTALAFFAEDRDYPVEYEPIGWDFLSPALTEADLMRRVLSEDAFAEWVSDFFPALRESPYDSIREPVSVDTESADGAALHLVGLNLSKAWCLAGLAETLDEHSLSNLLAESAARHARSGVDAAFTDDYAGSHWLSSFVLYLLTRDDGGIALSA